MQRIAAFLASDPARVSSPDYPDERRMTSGVRVLLAATALAATRIDPSEPSRFVGFTYTALTLYLVYAALVFASVRFGRKLSPKLQHLLPLIDVGVYAALIGLSGGSNSIFFVLFFFGILTASFEGGLAHGVIITVLSVSLFVIVGYATRPADPEFDLNRFLLRSTTLPVLGYLIAYRGGYELRLRRRLALLRDIVTISNPRFGPDRLLARSLEQLRLFFDADLSLAILPAAAGYELRAATRRTAASVADPESLPASLAEALLTFGGEELVSFRRGWLRPSISRSAGSWGASSSVSREQCERVAELLGICAYLTVPLRRGTKAGGRLYVAARRPRFDAHDRDFLLQAADQIMPALAHVELVERMTDRAADEERQRIALDIHDRIIQPHIGLQIGISAVEQLADDPDGPTVLPVVRERLRKLSDLAAHSITDLRGYVQELRHGGSPIEGTGLIQGLRRFGRRFQEATRIDVAIDAPDHVNVSDRLGAEVFSMASEAVSNVRRHTNAPSVRIRLRKTENSLVLRVENPVDADMPGKPFLPRSIAQRAAAVNGTITVESGGDHTAVIVDIPL